MPGFFLVIEGPEGAGKSTLARGIACRLRAAGIDPVEVREPGGTPVAEAARAIFLDPDLDTSDVSELFLVLAARADLVRKVIQPALEAGRVVVSDRYYYSTFAYQVAGRGLDAVAVERANALATGGLVPDLVVVLDLPGEMGRERQRAAGKEPDRLELADREVHDRVVEYFIQLSDPGVVHLDASPAADDVAEETWRVVEARFGEAHGRG